MTDSWHGEPYVDDDGLPEDIFWPDNDCPACQQTQYRHAPGCPIDDPDQEREVVDGDPTFQQPCRDCDGTGETFEMRETVGWTRRQFRVGCPRCEGTGHDPDRTESDPVRVGG